MWKVNLKKNKWSKREGIIGTPYKKWWEPKEKEWNWSLRDTWMKFRATKKVQLTNKVKDNAIFWTCATKLEVGIHLGFLQKLHFTSLFSSLHLYRWLKFSNYFQRMSKPAIKLRACFDSNLSFIKIITLYSIWWEYLIHILCKLHLIVYVLKS